MRDLAKFVLYAWFGLAGGILVSVIMIMIFGG